MSKPPDVVEAVDSLFDVVPAGCVDMYGQCIEKGQGLSIVKDLRMVRCVCRLKDNRSALDCDMK